jgi:WD40 repeat protein
MQTRALRDPPLRSAVPISTVAFSPDGTIVAAGGFGGVRLWNVRAHRSIALLPGRGYVRDVAFSPSGDVLTAADEVGVRMWDVHTHNKIGAPAGAYPGAVWSGSVPTGGS